MVKSSSYALSSVVHTANHSASNGRIINHHPKGGRPRLREVLIIGFSLGKIVFG